MEFRHNQVLGFGKFLVDVQRLLLLFFMKGEDPVELSFYAKIQVLWRFQ